MTFCYVEVFDLSIRKKVFMEAELKDVPQSDVSDIVQGLFLVVKAIILFPCFKCISWYNMKCDCYIKWKYNSADKHYINC